MQLYISGISEFTELPGAELLDNARRSRLEKYKVREDRQRCLVAGLLLRYALGDRIKQIEFMERGKPFLPQGPCFNLSHSGDYVILAVSASELGADIEKIGSYKDRLARRCCTEDELSWLSARDPSAFYRLWTGKESIMKATGSGLSMDPGSFSLCPAEDGQYLVFGRPWYLCWPELFDDHCICVASPQKEEPEIIYVSEKTLIGEEYSNEA